MPPSKHTHPSHLKNQSTSLSIKPKNTTTTPKSSTLKNSTFYDDDPFANMQGWVDYQEKIQLLKTTIAPMKKPTSKNYGSTVVQQQKRQHPSTTEASYPGNISSNISILSSGSSSSNSSDGCITPPRCTSPLTMFYEEQQSKDKGGDISLEDRVRFLAFLRHRTGWNVKKGAVNDLDYMQAGGSLFCSFS